MHDARDAEDTRLLEAGEYAALVEGYYGVILDRCRIRATREDDAIAVVAEVTIRLLSELKRGRRYRVPFLRSATRTSAEDLRGRRARVNTSGRSLRDSPRTTDDLD
jgi:hypothetical protein